MCFPIRARTAVLNFNYFIKYTTDNTLVLKKIFRKKTAILTEIVVDWCHRRLSFKQHRVHVKKKRHTTEIKVQIIALKTEKDNEKIRVDENQIDRKRYLVERMRDVCGYHLGHRKSYAHDDQQFAVKRGQSGGESLTTRQGKKNWLTFCCPLKYQNKCNCCIRKKSLSRYRYR